MSVHPLLIVCTTGLFAIFSSTISKSPVLPLFASHLGAGPGTVGIIAAVSAFTGFVASIPAGILSDRLGSKRLLMVAAAVFATAPFLYLFVTTAWQLIIVRFYHGLATAIFIPVSMALIAELYQDSRGERIGWFSSSTLAGRFLAPLIGGAIIGSFVMHPDIGYRTVYIVCGGAGLAVFILALKVPQGRVDVRAEVKWRDTFRHFVSAIAHPGILATSAVESSILFAYGAFETFLPIHAVRSGLGAVQVGVILSAQVITLALTKPVMGRYSDRHGRRSQIIAGALASAACIALVGNVRAFLPLLLLSVLFGLALSIVTSATSALVADLSRRESYGSAMGILGSIMDIGHTTGPVFAGIVAASSGFGTAFMASGGVVFAVAIIFAFLSARIQVPVR